MNKIIVATDFSPPADRALDVAIDLAKRLGATLEIVHVSSTATYALPPPFEVARLGPDPKDLERTDESLAVRRQKARDAGLERVATIALVGPPHEEIARRAADMSADLIIVGSHGRGALSRVLIGSVADRVVHASACPVMVVPLRSPA